MVIIVLLNSIQQVHYHQDVVQNNHRTYQIIIYRKKDIKSKANTILYKNKIKGLS